MVLCLLVGRWCVWGVSVGCEIGIGIGCIRRRGGGWPGVERCFRGQGIDYRIILVVGDETTLCEGFKFLMGC